MKEGEKVDLSDQSSKMLEKYVCSYFYVKQSAEIFLPTTIHYIKMGHKQQHKKKKNMDD